MDVLIVIILIIVIPNVIVFGIKKLVAISKENAIEEKRAQEKAQDEARKNARRAELRKHPVMTEVYEAIREVFPAWVRQAKETDTSQGAVHNIWVESSRVCGWEFSVSFASLGYAALSYEDQRLFAEALREMLVKATKDTEARVGEVRIGSDIPPSIAIDLSAYQKQLKPF